MPELEWSKFKLRLESPIKGALDDFLNKQGAADGIIYNPDRGGREHGNLILTIRVLDAFFTQVEEHLIEVENTTDRIEVVSLRIQTITARTTPGAFFGTNEVPLDDVDYRCWAFIVARLSYSNDFSNETIQALYREHEREIGHIAQSCAVRKGDSREKSKLQNYQCRRYLAIEVVQSLNHYDEKLKQFSKARKDREEEEKRAGEVAEDAAAEKTRALEAQKKRDEEKARAALAYTNYKLALTDLDITFLNAKIDKVFNFGFLKEPIRNAWTKVVNAQINQGSMNAFQKNLVVGLFTGIARYAPEPFKTVAVDLTDIATSFLSADAGSTEQATKAPEGTIKHYYDNLRAIQERFKVQVGYRIDLAGVELIVASIDDYAKAAKIRADEAFVARKEELFGNQSSSAEEHSKFKEHYPRWLEESNQKGETADQFDIQKKVTELFDSLPEKQFEPAATAHHNKIPNNTKNLTDFFALYMFASFVVENFLTVQNLDPDWDINGPIDNPYGAVYKGGIIPPAIIQALNDRENDYLNIILPPPQSSRFAYNSRDRHSTVSIPVVTDSRRTMGGTPEQWEVNQSGRYKFPYPPDEKHSHAFALICLWITKNMNPFEKALNDTDFTTYHKNQKEVIDYWTTAIKSNKNPTSISRFKSVFRGSGSGDWNYEGPQGILRKVRRTWNIN